MAKEKLHVLCNFFLCHYVFKKPSAVEASEIIYMRERVNLVLSHSSTLLHSLQPVINGISRFFSDEQRILGTVLQDES